MKRKAWKERGRQALAVALSAAMLMPSAGIAVQVNAANAAGEAKKDSAKKQAEVPSYRTEENTGREQINFNRSWKFIRSDIEGAAAVDYDDSAWVDVGLPHNFSIPYEMSSQFYVGYGWYRKNFNVPSNWNNKKVELEFEGVFQIADVYVNGEKIGTHRGGYSGFVYDITDYLHKGDNVIAVRVNNIWQHDLAPRAGDHQFTGGIYRDVYLNVTEDVHVTWYGTFVTTPDLTNPGFDSSAKNIDFTQYPSEDTIKKNIADRKSNVRVQTEVKNDSDEKKEVQVIQKVEDADGKMVTEFASEEHTLNPDEIYNFDSISNQVQDIHLWSVDDPYLYKVYTSVISDGVEVDTYESPLGFRWAEYKNDGFYLNGEKVLLDGANAHQDHAGLADAVSDEGFYRDVSMIKECGMNFIRGSHYPHDPSYAAACDKLGVLFWSECNFWGMGGSAGKDADATYSASDWFKDAYPQNPEDEAAFEQSCLDSLEAMIRVNRNHPSIINWSMGNEVFFTNSSTQNKAKDLVNKMRNKAHELDPTRKAGMGGCQREGYDSLDVCDIAGYNGDGGKFQNNNMPNVVAEYGSKVQDRPGEYRPFYDQIQGSSSTEYKLQKNSAGLSLWCAFHHGTIGGDGLAKMGIIDYYRLPTNSWYWYREKNTGVAPEASQDGTVAKMELTTSDTEITNDGKKDAKLIVTMEDAEGNWVSDTRNVTLTVVKGPGTFPGGKSYTFTAGKSIRDGKASIEFRSYYAGETVIKAQAEGLPDATITLTTKDVTGDEKEKEPEDFYDATKWGTLTEKIEEPFAYGSTNAATGRPLFPSSNKLEAELATDGKTETSWVAEKTGSGEYFMLDLEFALYVYKIGLDFEKTPYPYKVETAMDKNGEWTTIAEYTKDTVTDRKQEETLDGIEARYVKVTFTDVPENEKASLSEIAVYGNVSSQAPQYQADGVYLSDVVDYDSITTGWKTPGKDISCEGADLSVGGITYKKGIGLHANSEIVYNTEKKYSRISGVAGIDNEVSGGNAIFQIYADNKLIYERELSGGEADAFDLSISGVEKLRLVTDANGNNSEDHTDWADVKLYGAIRDITRDNGKVKITAASMNSKLHAGETYQALLKANNESEQETNISSGLILYNTENQITNLTTKTTSVPEGKTQSTNLSLEMPETLKGYHGEILLWDDETLEPLSKATLLYPDENYLDAVKKEIVWTKVDGEDSAMVKKGTWTIWNSDKAYQGTETCNNDASGNSSISYTFNGNYVQVGVKIDGSQVGADVYIDDQKVGHIDARAADNTINNYQKAWSSEKLSDGQHTIKLVPTGKFGLDYIETGIEKESQNTDGQISDAKQKLYAQTAEVLQKIADGSILKYTKASRSALAQELKKAITLCQNVQATDSDCNVASENLGNAVKALEKQPDTPETPSTETETPSTETETPSTETKAPESETKTPATNKPSVPDQPKKIPAKGSVHRSAGGVLVFKVTKSDSKNGTVTVNKLLNKKVSKVTIPETVTIDGYTFKVTAVSDNVFKKAEKLKSVVIGANVKSIGKKSFRQCKKLAAITFKGTKAPKIGKNAFQSVKAKVKVTVPKKMKKAQLKKLKKALKKAAGKTKISYKSSKK